MDAIDIINATIAKRHAQGLTVERYHADESRWHARHCVDAADRDAYIARCNARGDLIRIVGE